MAPFEALKMARERNLDLVEISPTAQPRFAASWIMGNSCTRMKARARSQEKTEDHYGQRSKVSYQRRRSRLRHQKNHVLRFLDEGDKVKATIFFRGREMTRQSLGRQILERLIKDVEHKGLVEFRPRQEGNTLHLILAPKKDAGAREKPAPRNQRLRHRQHRAGHRRRRAALSHQENLA